MILPKDPEELCTEVVSVFKRVQGEMADWRDRSSVYYRLYNSYVDEDIYPLPFKLFFPIPHSTIETLVPRYVHGLLYRNPMVEVMPAHPQTDPISVNNANRLLNKWMSDTDTWTDILMALKESLLIGTAGGYVEFERKKRLVKDRKPVMVGNEMIDVIEHEYYANYINRPVFRHTDMYDVYPDLDRFQPSRMRFVFRLIVKGMDEIRADGESMGYDPKALDELEEAGDWPTQQTMHDYRLRTSLVEPRSRAGIWDPAIIPDHPRAILEMTVRSWSEEGEVVRIITVGNEKVLMRPEDRKSEKHGCTIDYWPWIFFRHNPMPHEFLGRSVLQPIERMCFAYNDLLNMNLTNMLAAISKMILISDDAEIDPDQLVLEPFNLIQGASVNADNVRFESFGDINPSGMKLEQSLGEGIQQATGISDFLRGANPQRKEYASTVMALQQAAEARIDSQIKLYEKDSLVPLARAFIECAQAELDEPEPVSDPKDPTRLDTIDMWGIQGLLDYKVNATAMGVQEAQRAQLNDFAQAVNQVLGQQADPLLRQLVIRAMAQQYNAEGMQDLRNEIDAIIQQTKQQQQQQLLAQQQQQQQAAQPGGGAPPPGQGGAPVPPPGAGMAGPGGQPPHPAFFPPGANGAAR